MLNKIRINKTELLIIFLVIFQIFLLMNVSVAQSYTFHQVDSVIDNFKRLEEQKNQDTIKNLVGSGINLLIGFFSIKQIGVVSAQGDLSLNCCINMEDGSVCQEILPAEADKCESGLANQSCDSVSDCRKGCCYDAEEGICSPNSPKKFCESESGEWKDSVNCDPNDVPECRLGCCIFGGNAKFTLERKCEKISSFYGFEKTFEDIRNELDCLAQAAGQTQGACILEGNNCRRTTGEECVNMLGHFYPNYLCSHPSLETGCEKQSYIECAEDYDEIYWFDSCGNRENIYYQNRVASYNEGKILSKNDSCGGQIVSGSDKLSTTCGNCAYLESTCAPSVEADGKKVVDGDFICKNLNCINAPANVGTQNRVNGESWCLYDGYIGEGKDTIGSEHWLAYCHEGTVEVDRCGEYRSKICQESVIEEAGKEFTMASCVENMGSLCLTYNEDDDMEEKCEENKHCMISQVSVDKYFKFSMCVPRYPTGFDLSEDADISIYEETCNIGSQTCKLVEKKEIDEWDAVSGFKQCRDQEFPDKLHNFCITLGDCGSYVNFIGEGTDNEATSGKKSNNPKGWETYKEYADAVEGQKVDPLELEDLINLGIISADEYGEDALSDTLKKRGSITGALGVVGFLPVYLGAFTPATFASLPYVVSQGWIGTAVGSVATAFSAAIAGFIVGAGISYYLCKKLGVSADATKTYMIMGGLAGATAALVYFTFIPVYGWIAVAVIVVAMVVLYSVFDYGKMRDRPIKFKCEPWQAPSYESAATAEAQCRKCNEDPLRPCTEYRCLSLGQTCQLLNAGLEENPICESIPREVEPPIISPGSTSLNYTFTDEQTKGVDLEAKHCLVQGSNQCKCIPEWTTINFTLQTNEFSQCKWSYEKPLNPAYDEMPENYPNGISSFKEEHTFTIMMPSIDSPELEELMGSVKEQYGDMKIYVKCKDKWENYNVDEYVVNFCVNSGPDVTPVSHIFTKAIPEDESTLEYNKTEQEVTFYINEPADCKYDYTEGIAFENMANSMTCNPSIYARGLLGWPCETTLTNLSNENTIYMKCKDQPWATDDTIRNINTEDLTYTLYTSESPLKIDSISPEGVIEHGFEPLTIDLEVKTSGGSEHGSSYCYWGNIEGEENFAFYDTGTSLHTQTLTDRMGGKYEFYIKCEDSAGNIATDKANFEIKVDDFPPTVVRAFNDGGVLRVITDEPAECYYDLNKCNFNIENATKMTTGLSEEHTAEWRGGVTYHIKCLDLWENMNPNCAIKVTATQ